MHIGLPTEIKNHEYRVGLTPASVRELCSHGHSVLVQSGAADTGLGWLALSALPVLLLADSLGRRLSGYISVSAYHNLSAGLLCLSACLAVYPVLR